MHRLVLFGLWLLVASAPARGAEPPGIDVAATPNLPWLARQVEVLEDPQRQWDLAGVQAPPAKPWQPLGEDILRIGYSPSAWWVRVRLINGGREERSLIVELASSRVDLLDIFVIADAQVRAGYRTGDQRPFASRPLHHPTFALPLDLAPGAEVQVYLRLDSISDLFPPLAIRLWEARDFEASRQWATLGWGLYYGAGCALLVYNLLLFLATRERNFLFYVIYLGAFLLVHLGFVSGLGFQNLWPERPGWNNQFDLLLPALLHLPATLLVTQFLETRHRAPGWHRLLWGMTVLMLAIPLILYGLAFGQGGFSSHAVIGAIRVFILLNGLLLLLYLLAAWRVWRQGFGAAGYFTLAWSCLILGVLVHHLHRLPGLLPSGFLIDNSLTLGSTLEYLLLALALGDRFNQLKEARREAERREHALQRAYATDLERQVEERTQALREAMTQTQAALEGERLAREEQREFLLTLSHDLRTPLAVIDNIAQNLALEATEDDCPNRTRFDRILEASARMIRLLDDYLDEKRFSLLREGPRRLPCDWGRLLEEAAAAARLLSHHHRFQVEVGDCPAGVLCDPKLTTLALRTLADNAVKYTPAGTRVTLSARRAGQRQGDGVWLEVADTGPGLNPAELERLFDPLFRGAASQDQPGKGMGLPLARRVIQTQGGTLTALSRPGQGCRFRIWLPGPRSGAGNAVPPPPEGGPQEGAGEHLTTAGSSPRS